MHLGDRGKENDFSVQSVDIGIMGRGENIENCFADVALVMFNLMVDVGQIHQIQILTFEFEAEDLELALVTWLNLLLLKAKEHQLMFGDFRLKREGSIWKATVAGEKKTQSVQRGLEVKEVTMDALSIKKIDYIWEARCIVNV